MARVDSGVGRRHDGDGWRVRVCACACASACAAAHLPARSCPPRHRPASASARAIVTSAAEVAREATPQWSPRGSSCGGGGDVVPCERAAREEWKHHPRRRTPRRARAVGHRRPGVGRRRADAPARRLRGADDAVARGARAVDGGRLDARGAHGVRLARLGAVGTRERGLCTDSRSAIWLGSSAARAMSGATQQRLRRTARWRWLASVSAKCAWARARAWACVGKRVRGRARAWASAGVRACARELAGKSGEVGKQEWAAALAAASATTGPGRQRKAGKAIAPGIERTRFKIVFSRVHAPQNAQYWCLGRPPSTCAHDYVLVFLASASKKTRKGRFCV